MKLAHISEQPYVPSLHSSISDAIIIIIKNNKKTFPIKMIEDVGMSKPKKHENKVRWDPKLNKPLPYI